MDTRSILSFWRDIEIFNLPNLEKEVKHLKPNSILPWESNPINSSKDYVWQYTLFFGRIPKAEVIEKISELLKVEENEFVEKQSGNTCLAALMLDEAGRPDEKSYLQASYIHGIRCLEQSKSMSKVPELLVKVQEDYALRYHISEEDRIGDINGIKTINEKGLVVSWKILTEELECLKEITSNWNKEIQIFYTAKEVFKNFSPDPSFLNSFYLEDLNVLHKEDVKSYGNAFKDFLALNEQSDNVDILKQKDKFIECLDPAILPPGRWPSKFEFGLYSAQTGAVNSIMHSLKSSSGIRGVNGPPGTGKTTLLKDIIADIIVQRAKRVIDAGATPLFSGYTKIENEKGFNSFYNPLASVFANSGIVVSSNNNSAVENITKELPARNGIDKEFASFAYFSECSKRLISEESWGILSAALGNSGNRNKLIQGFWKTDKTDNNNLGFDDLLKNAYKTKEDTLFYEQKLDEVKKELIPLFQKFSDFQKSASSFHQDLPKQIQRLTDHKRLFKEQNEIATQILNEKNIQQELNYQLATLASSIKVLRETLDAYNKQKPFFFFFHKLFNTTTYKVWYGSVKGILESLQNSTQDHLKVTSKLTESGVIIKKLQSNIEEVKRKLSEISLLIRKYDSHREELHTMYGIAYEQLVDPSFILLDYKDIHLRTPYSSEQINQLRSTIFINSLEVHRYAILANAKFFWNNLQLFFDVLIGRVKVKDEVAVQLWDTMFFCIPVISTTLASVSRLFAPLKRESIGWLLLDEAGQATPQSAAGLIWRSRRCVIVGDPLQIEPVNTIPEALVAKLRSQNNVPVVWSPLASSVQSLADRTSKLGTYMTQGKSDHLVWAGFPLRTHRRCDNPMFSIANEIAYSNQMVKSQADVFSPLARSEWFSVEGATMINKHAIKEELDALIVKINETRAKGYLETIFVISPFKTVESACQEMLKTTPNILCGTIHTFQGKEADVVFLVLGSNPTTSGARSWASQKPNMLNVALTRAKRRFYVIGNKKLWAKCDYFDVMAMGLANPL